jgi:hypothetical protein
MLSVERMTTDRVHSTHPFNLRGGNMRVLLIAIVIALLGCGLLNGNESFVGQTTQRTNRRFTISKYGTLLELFNADGSAAKKIAGDGFKLQYKTLGKIRSASAIEMETKGLQTASQRAKYEGCMATAVVQTADRSLEITSQFAFDDKTGDILIKRNFRNISKSPVALQEVWNYFDAKVMFRGELNQSANLVAASLAQITAGIYSDPEDCDMNECPVGPICRYPPGCPTPPQYLGVWLYPSEKDVVLGRSMQINLKPKRNQQSGDKAFIVIRVTIK